MPASRTRLVPLPGDEGLIVQRAWSRSRRLELADRLWPKVQGPWCSGINEDGTYFEITSAMCWLWIPGAMTGAYRMKNGKRVKHVGGGYGRIHAPTEDEPERLIGHHIAAYLVTHGPFPAGWVIGHRCDTRLCANPSHLVAQPQAHNAREAIERGRMKTPHEYLRERLDGEVAV